MRRKLGAESNLKPWRWSDYSWKIRPRFGRMTGMWKCHYLVSEALELATSGHHDQYNMFLVQLLKSLHQSAIDGGDWSNAGLLLPVEDPLAGDDFGGDPEELLVCHGYRSAVSELRKKNFRKPEDGEDQDEAGEKGKKGGGRGGGK